MSSEYARLRLKAARIREQIEGPNVRHEVVPQKVVYRGPEGQVWDGKGHTPKWVRDYERDGLSRAVWRVEP